MFFNTLDTFRKAGNKDMNFDVQDCFCVQTALSDTGPKLSSGDCYTLVRCPDAALSGVVENRQLMAAGATVTHHIESNYTLRAGDHLVIKVPTFYLGDSSLTVVHNPVSQKVHQATYAELIHFRQSSKKKVHPSCTLVLTCANR